MNLVNAYFTPLQNCRYSSNFNSPIESYWGLAKRRFNKKLLLQHEVVNEDLLHRMVRESLEGISAQAHSGLLRANHSYIRRWLEIQIE